MCWWEPQKAAYYGASNAHHDFPYLANPGVGVHDPARSEAEAAEKRTQCRLLRDVFGNPFCPVAFFPDWRIDTTVTLEEVANGKAKVRRLAANDFPLTGMK